MGFVNGLYGVVRAFADNLIILGMFKKCGSPLLSLILLASPTVFVFAFPRAVCNIGEIPVVS